MPIDARRFPRLARYLGALPREAASYPECHAKGAIVRALLEARPMPPEAIAVLPDGIAALVRNPPLPSTWIPEVHLMGLSLSLADACALSDAEYLDWLYAVNRAMLAGRFYAPVMALASPAFLLDLVGRRWASLHRGTALENGPQVDQTVELRLTFPPRLYDRLLLETYAQAFRAAIDTSRARSSSVELVEHSATSAVYRAKWT